MKRVASLYLPDWPIERIVLADRAERTAAPPDESARGGSNAIARCAEHGQRREASSDAGFGRGAAPPGVEGWRPGARWARADERADRSEQAQREAHIAAPPPRQRPPPRDLGRDSEAAGHPFKPMPPDEGGSPVRDARVAIPARNTSPPWKGGVGGGLVRGERRASSTTTHSRLLPSRTGGQTVPASCYPLVTSIQRGNRLVIAAASPAARAIGIVPGMAVTQARAQVPDLDIRPADPAGDRAALLRLAMLAARRWCPLVALSGEDGLLLDITGTAHLFGGEARMARRIVRLLAHTGHRAQVAVADTPGAAWALARFALPTSCAPRRHARAGGDDEKGDYGTIFLCPPAGHADALAPLPTAALRLEPRAIDLLKRLGVDTVDQLAALPRAPLMRRFGGSLVARLDQVSGRLPEPLDPVMPPEHIAVVQRFAEPIATAEAIAHWLGVLMQRLTAALAQAGLGARAVELVADRIDGVPQRLRIGLARPTRDAGHLLRLTVRRIEEIAPGYGIDALALHVRRAGPLGAEPFVERLDAETVPDLAPLVDTLAGRIGAARLWRIAPVESDVPERAATLAPVLDPASRAAPRLKPGDVRSLDRTADLHPWHHRWPRPVRMLRRPEPLDHVIAELPDQPPRRFTWRGTAHRVVRADGPERILGEWWKRPSERHSVRDYFRVEDESGQRFWLFRRGDGERGETGDLAWFMHGSFG